MEQLIVTGVDASGIIQIDPTQYAYIKSVEIDLPLSEVGSTDPKVTLSGIYTGAVSFYGDTTLDLRFKPNEEVYVTTDAFGSGYSAVVRYVIGGANKEVYNNTDTTRVDARFVPTFWRYR
jgi:hypothetical protein